MRDSNGDSSALSPKVVRQRPLTREHPQIVVVAIFAGFS